MGCYYICTDIYDEFAWKIWVCLGTHWYIGVEISIGINVNIIRLAWLGGNEQKVHGCLLFERYCLDWIGLGRNGIRIGIGIRIGMTGSFGGRSKMEEMKFIWHCVRPVLSLCAWMFIFLFWNLDSWVRLGFISIRLFYERDWLYFFLMCGCMDEYSFFFSSVYYLFNVVVGILILV